MRVQLDKVADEDREVDPAAVTQNPTVHLLHLMATLRAEPITAHGAAPVDVRSRLCLLAEVSPVALIKNPGELHVTPTAIERLPILGQQVAAFRTVKVHGYSAERCLDCPMAA
jgi:hypothetical protein